MSGAMPAEIARPRRSCVTKCGETRVVSRFVRSAVTALVTITISADA